MVRFKLCEHSPKESCWTSKWILKQDTVKEGYSILIRGKPF